MPKIKGTAGQALLWKGPQVDGVTYSLLCRFLSCRERFRLRVVEGLVPRQKFEPDRDWGSLWHTCEECCGGDPRSNSWKLALERDVGALAARYPLQRDDIALARDVCRLMFEIYLDWQAERAEDDGDRRMLLSEQVFDVPYVLPSGRRIRLRGKLDRVELVEGLKIHGATSKDLDGMWVTDHKTKGQVNEERIGRQLRFDFQTMIYLVALDGAQEMNEYPLPLADVVGVRYNVIRKPQHRQGKNESRNDFLLRLRQIVRDDPGHFFYRWDVTVSAEDVARFRRETLDPILEQLCDWWEWVNYATMRGVGPFDVAAPGRWGCSAAGGIHWRSPFGVYDPLAHGRETEYDGFLESGSLVGLERTDNLFPELSD